ncbi:MAG: PGPGW domain-containing protein [Nitriliruptoraceae bacterium]
MLGPVRAGLWPGEEIAAWSHANVPGVRAPGLLVVTDRRCLLHVATSSVPDVDTPLHRLSGFDLERSKSDRVRVQLNGSRGQDVLVELSLTSRARSRAVGRVLSALTRHDILAPESFDAAMTSPLPPMPRGVRGQARRVWVTVVGVLVLLVSVAFASPFVPGPGALTAVAGFAILAKEYEWARDVHVWAARLAERFISWTRKRLRLSRSRTGVVQGPEPAAPSDRDVRQDLEGGCERTG